MQMHQAGQSSNLSPQDLQNYFGWPPPPLIIYSLSDSPQKRQRFLLIGLVLVAAFFLCSFFSQMGIGVLGWAVVAGTIFVLVKILQQPIVPPSLPTVPPPPPGPTDEEYEAWVKSWRGSIHQLGMQRIGLDVNEIKARPLYIRSIIWPNSNDARYYQSRGGPVCIKRGMDGRPHGSVNRFTFFYPTQHYLAVFICDVNALGTMHFEGTSTYFYDDIVGIETKSFDLDAGSVNYVMQHFDLRVSSGQSIGATTYVHDLDVDQTVKALRTLLRDKKYGTQGGGLKA